MADSENDIWEYKPLKKTKREETSEPTEPVAKKKRASRRTTKGETAVKQAKRNVKPTSSAKGRSHKATSNVPLQSQPPSTAACPPSTQTDRTIIIDLDVDNKLSPGGFCPICQMPFSKLVAQSQRWHVSECLDTPGDDSKECPDGIQCCSAIQSHYKRFGHAALALSRATNDTQPRLSQGRTSSNESPGCSFSTEREDMSSFVSVSSQGSDLALFAPSSPGPSPIKLGSVTSTPSKPKTNALLLLRSPGPEDIRKKKGWSPTVKGRKSPSASQESTAKVFTPKSRKSPSASQESTAKVLTPKSRKSPSASQASTAKVLTSTNADRESPALKGGFVRAEPSPPSDDEISYSPLSEFPPDLEIDATRLRNGPFPPSASENDRSAILFDDSLSDEDIFADLVRREAKDDDTQVMAVSSSADINRPPGCAAAENVFSSISRGETDERAEVNFSGTGLGSPQSIVLDRLRQRISHPNSRSVLRYDSLNEGPPSSLVCTQQTPSSSQTSSTQLSQRSVAPRKGRGEAGTASGLKQTDIGVFFGIKPLKEKEVEDAVPERKPGSVSGESFRGRGRREGGREGRREGGGRWERKGAVVGAVEASGVAEGTPDDVVTQSARGGWRRGGGGGGGRGGGRRWRNKTDGEPKRCPFYKKIPGTKFVVDAFQYGMVDGVTAYFLTHFHSDHYGGLKKNSTFPVYCNKVTGNLVRTKLKVAEEFVHVLPMNTEVTVEGVRLVLLEANHCPGAAMLLLFLPDGQVVLHVGDFRADPSMERYPQLLSCRVQTLYLDTTYCSPEYTFPSQKEVVNFAASTAFERITLNPRTLIVCGSYSVGKEKVFLALAEVLGSKVCMSRDKFNTMCCLESEDVRRLITTDWKAAQVHVLPMMQLNFKNLQAHLERFSGQYDQLVAFKPTGWTFSQKAEAVENILPQTSGSISIYGVPYSEHSSFLELKRFVQWLRPLKIIPTVNVGSRDSRNAMETCFREWLTEANAEAN